MKKKKLEEWKIPIGDKYETVQVYSCRTRVRGPINHFAAEVAGDVYSSPNIEELYRQVVDALTAARVSSKTPVIGIRCGDDCSGIDSELSLEFRVAKFFEIQDPESGKKLYVTKDGYRYPGSGAMVIVPYTAERHEAALAVLGWLAALKCQLEDLLVTPGVARKNLDDGTIMRVLAGEERLPLR